ncbi:SseB family protein [Micromonospora sp. SL4-19]|uniref:SseB family protein n=1 Tax=Micromonospora sp. SL4-19 TaxID=3399129 RepID=UPI003A4D929B
MTGWEPATEAEVAMWDALRAQDQQRYFQLLTRVDLLLPVAAAALAGQAPVDWGTWTTGGRTHVLAFTSATALRTCLGQNAGATRRVPYADLAAGWPNQEWWLAVNPGLPIEGYLPAWFVAQLARGDVRLPGRTMGARARLERVEAVARARAAAAARDAAMSPAAPAPGGRASAAPVPPASGGHGPATAGEPSTVPVPHPAAPVPVPGVAEPAGPPAARWPEPTGDHPAPQRPGDDGPVRAGWPAPASRTDSVPAGAPAPPSGRSFFEPAAGRSSRRLPPHDPSHRSGERVVPPSRLTRGDQPFPRRRPLIEPVREEPTRSLRMDGGETTQALRPAEPPPPFRPAPAADEEATQALPRRRPLAGDGPESDERTHSTPPGPGDAALAAPAEELPRSVAEPVSGPPEPRRGFSPIVIEGTVIESRDLTTPDQPPSAGSASGPAPVPPQPYAVPTVPAATSAMATAAVSADRSDGDGPGAPWAGPADPTMPLTIDPPAAPAEAPANPQSGSLFDAPSDANFGENPPGARRGLLFEPPAAPDVPLFEPSVSPAAAPASLFKPAPAAERRTTPAEPTASPPVEPTAPPPGEPTAPVAVPAPSEAPEPVPADFVPANDVEEELLGAAGSGSTDGFLSTLLLARVLLPVAAGSAPGSRPGDPGFVWRTEQLDGETYVVVYTSPERLADRAAGPVDTVRVKFVQLIRRWPDESWSFAVNPGTPAGAKYPGEQVLALANWAAEVGLGEDPESEPDQPAAEAEPVVATRPAAPPVDPARPVIMQKAVAPSQLAYYLERGYDRVSGFVHRASELAHLSTPAQLYDALGLGHPGSPFSREDVEIYVLRWPVYRPSLYRIPYGGQNEAAMRAMEGWVIERPPFRGNGFAPGESSDVVAEFKVDSARLPHGAQLCRIGADGSGRVVATLDTDALLWRQVGES